MALLLQNVHFHGDNHDKLEACAVAYIVSDKPIYNTIDIIVSWAETHIYSVNMGLPQH